MFKSTSLKKFFLVFLSFYLCGCFKFGTKEPVNLSQAQEKLIQIAKDEFHYDIVTKRVGKTIWVYLPIKYPLVEAKAANENTPNSNQPTESLSLRFIDARFNEKNFEIEYDIATTKTYSKSLGYTSGYSQEYLKAQQNILSAIQRSFLDLDPLHAKESLPQFIVFVIADVVRGIEIVHTVYFDDLKKGLSLIAALSQEEFTKRFVYEVRGDNKIKEDLEGKHIEYREINLSEFLAKQIVQRITYKYQSSAFSPSEDTKKEILKQAADVIDAYNFSDFEGVKITDLNTKTTETIQKPALEDLKDKDGHTIEMNFALPSGM